MARPLRRAPGCKRSPLLRQLCRRRVNGCSFATSAAPSAARGVPRAPRLSPAGRTVLDLVRPAKVCGSRVEPPCVGRGRGRRCVSSRGSRLLLRPFQLGLCWRPAREAPGWGGGGGSSASPTGRAGRSGGGRPCFPAGLPSGRLCPVASGRGNSELGLARAPRKPRCGNGSLCRGLWGPSRPREVSSLSSFRAFPGCSSSSGVGAVDRVPEKGGPRKQEEKFPSRNPSLPDASRWQIRLLGVPSAFPSWVFGQGSLGNERGKGDPVRGQKPP